MKKFPFKKIDAFATQNSAGNPAGYVLLDDPSDISEQEMLQVAREMQGFVNEVGYVAPIGANKFALRYFSAEREVDFCGHATIAIMYDMVKSNIEIRKHAYLEISTNKGTLEIENRFDSDDSVFAMSPKPDYKTGCPEPDYIASSLDIAKHNISENLPISIINAGLDTLLVSIIDLNSILSISPDLEGLKIFCQQIGVDIITVFSQEVSNPINDFRTRVFAPTFGYLEDPATGSGNSALGYYLLEHKLWKDEVVRIEQNGTKDASNLVRLQKKIDNDGKVRVWFGGSAVTRIEGKYIIHHAG